MTKHWNILPRHQTDLIDHLLEIRGITPQDRPSFFNPTLDQLAPPTVFPHMDTAVQRVAQAITSQQKIIVWGDFDADGVTSTAILWQTLYSLGAQVMPYIPSRDEEGHGFSAQGIDQIQQDQVSLVITCDHGITAIEAIDQLQQQGIDVILTDHHEPLEREAGGQPTSASRLPPPASLQMEDFNLPSAIAILHPLQTDLGSLAGCGVAYYLAYAVWLNHHHKADTSSSRTEFADSYLDIAAIGTIADMMPLTATNRIIAAQGLKRLAQTKRPGLQQLYQLAKIDDKPAFGIYEVGFVIAPRLNAPGRLAHALDSLRLLCTTDPTRAATLARTLDFINRERQDLLAEVAQQAKDRAAESGHDGVFVLADPNWPAGVCGLAAGKIVEAFYRPAVVMEEQGDTSRGSARSIKDFDITAALTNIKDLLISYGGHAAAAGFVCQTANIPAIQQALTEQLFDQLDTNQLQPTLDIDAQVPLLELTDHLYHQLQQFEPTGMANRKPLFLSQSCQVISAKTMGADNKHLRLSVAQSPSAVSRLPLAEQVNDTPIESISDDQLAQIFSQPSTSASRLPPPASGSPSSPPLAAVGFGFGHLIDQLAPGAQVDIVYTLDQNTWQGRTSLQLMIKDIKIIVPTD